MKVKVVFKGGPGSGHFGHSGREGFVGGSDPGSGGAVGPRKPLPRNRHAASYDEHVEDATQRAEHLKISSYSDSKKVRGFASEAADAINSFRSGEKGGTVYGSSLTVFDDPSKQFPMVGFGAGTSKGMISRYMNILKQSGYVVAIGPEGQGIIVGHPSWK